MAFPAVTISNGTDADSLIANKLVAAGFAMPTGGLSLQQLHSAAIGLLLTDGPVGWRLPTSWAEGGVDAGAASSVATLLKKVTAIADNTATAVLTITVPNVAAAALITVDFLCIAGAAGAIGTCEDITSVSYNYSVARTPGVAMGAKMSTAFGSAAAVVTGAGTMTAVSADPTLMGEGVTVTNTGIIKITIDQSSTSTNHICLMRARVLNYLAGGVTLA